jgi:hypothetical protein
MNKIELHEQAIKLLEAIETYNRRAIDNKRLKQRAYLSGMYELEKNYAHSYEICRKVAERLTERYDKVIYHLIK